MSGYEEAINILTSKGRFHIDLGLERIKRALNQLGNPEKNLKFIHVAGTNGKGSVCAMLDSVLREAGYKTGLYTSPHIWDYTERIRINGICIEKEKFADYIHKISEIDIQLTEFEILTIMAFLYFNDQKADIVILETGLGGRLDATNVIEKNICSVITHIDLDHTEILGDTEEKIASEKAGIIKKDCPVITNEKYKAIEEKSKELNSSFIIPLKVDNKYINALSLKGNHQTKNLELVLTVLNVLFEQISEKTILNGLKKVNHPCRFEYIKEPNMIIDASHNPNGVQALRENLDIYFPNQKRRYVFGALNTKDYKKMMEILFKSQDEVYLNEFDYPKACSYEELAKVCPVNPKQYTTDVKLSSDKLNIICGSFYMIGSMKFLQKIC